MSATPLIVAEFETPEALGAAVRRLKQAGQRNLRSYTPFPLAELDAELVPARSRLPLVTLLGGIAGAGIGALMQYGPAVLLYPVNVGGRPLAAWPAFGPTLFEMTVLGAVLAGFVGFFVTTGLPRLSHPIFALPGFERASQDHFFLAIEPSAAERESVGALLAECHPLVLRELGP